MTQTRPRRASRRAWSYKTGGKGRNRVRVFEWSGSLWIDYREDGKRRRQALRHADRDRARQLADEIAQTLGTLQGVALPSALTLGTLFDMYEREVTPQKAANTQAHDRRVMTMARKCWGGATAVSSLDRRDWDRFIQMRRAGTLGHKSADGTIATNLRFVVAVMNWARAVRVQGRSLLERNPFLGCTMPKEMSPRQPAITEAEFQKLVAAAPRVNRYCLLFLMLVHETGHRYNAVAQLRWSDIDFSGELITWRAENDKLGYGHKTPASEECLGALRRVQLQASAIGDRPIFPSQKYPDRPVDRHRPRDWWRRLEVLSGVDRVPGRGWHSLRRKFATEHMDQPMRELMALGGWKNERTILACYQKPREPQMRAALARRSRARKEMGNG